MIQPNVWCRSEINIIYHHAQHSAPPPAAARRCLTVLDSRFARAFHHKEQQEDTDTDWERDTFNAQVFCFRPDYLIDPIRSDPIQSSTIAIADHWAGRQCFARCAHSLFIALSFFIMFSFPFFWYERSEISERTELSWRWHLQFLHLCRCRHGCCCWRRGGDDAYADSRQPTVESRQLAAVRPRIGRRMPLGSPLWNKCVRFKNKLKIMFLLCSLSHSLARSHVRSL